MAHAFSPAVGAALKDIEYESAYKVAWQTRRFWEQDDNIYGGLSFLRGPVHLLWYPSGDLMAKDGVLVSGYANERNSEFGKLPNMAAKLEASRAAVEAVHPGKSKELTHPLYVCWGQIPYSLGSWVSRSAKADGSTYYTGPFKTLLNGDDRVYFAGDHLTRLVAWQEGAVLSAHRAIAQLTEHRRAIAAGS
jgi:monoamine oxidase